MDLKAGVWAAVGAAAGGIAGAVFQASRNKPIENATLIAASIGAIVGASLAPRPAVASPAPSS